MPGPIRMMPEETKMRLEPRLVIWSLMVASVPALMAIMMMTAATPMMIPSMVSRDRTLFLRIASQAIRSSSSGCMVHILPGKRMRRFAVVYDRFDVTVFQADGPLGVGRYDGIVCDDHDGCILPV